MSDEQRMREAIADVFSQFGVESVEMVDEEKGESYTLISKEEMEQARERAPAPLTCECCGHTEELTGKEAFDQGWDAPPHFTQVVCCPLCLSAPLVLGEGNAKHARAHERWEREGRPASFEESKEMGDLDEYNLPGREEMVRTITDFVDRLRREGGPH